MMQSDFVLSGLGLLYPRCCWLESAHHRLAYAMKGKGDPRRNDSPQLDEELAELKASLSESNAHTALVSSEEFFTAPMAAIEKVAEQLQGYDIEIVAYVRRPDELVESAFNQKLKQVYRDFGDANVDYHIDDYLECPEKMIPDIDYNKYISRWARVFGAAKTRLVQYEAGDAIASMCNILGIEREKLVNTASRENSRASQRLVSMLRLAREVGASTEVQEKIRELAMTHFPHRDASGLLGPEDRRRIFKRFSKGNSELFKMLLNQSNPYDPELFTSADEDAGRGADRLRMRDLMHVLVSLLEGSAPPVPH